MSNSDVFVFEISKASFARSVIFNSHKLPVLVEFMAVWSEPCALMADTLTDLAEEFAGRFIFARADVEEQTELREEYDIQNVPTLMVFMAGEAVRTEPGQMKEPELRELLRAYGIFHESDEMREQARQKHLEGDTVGAITLFTEAIRKDPGNTLVVMDMVQVMLDLGEVDQARALYQRLPEKDRQGETGKTLSAQLAFRELQARTEGTAVLMERVATQPDDFDARFDLAICLVADFDYRGAVDQLFAIIEQAPDYREGAAREMVINLVNMLTPNEPALAQEIRRRLGSGLA